MNPQMKRLIDYLVIEKQASTNELRNQLGIAHPDTIVSRIRAVYGRDCITGHWMYGKNKFGEDVRFMMYRISDKLKAELTKVKPEFPRKSVFGNQT